MKKTLLILLVILSACTKGPSSEVLLNDIVSHYSLLTEVYEFEIEDRTLVEEQTAKMMTHLFEGICYKVKLEMSAVAKEDLLVYADDEPYRVGTFTVHDGYSFSGRKIEVPLSRTPASIQKELSEYKKEIDKATKDGKNCIDRGFLGCIRFAQVPLTEKEKSDKFNKKEEKINKDYSKSIQKGEAFPMKPLIVEYCKNNAIKPERWEKHRISYQK